MRKIRISFVSAVVFYSLFIIYVFISSSIYAQKSLIRLQSVSNDLLEYLVRNGYDIAYIDGTTVEIVVDKEDVSKLVNKGYKPEYLIVDLNKYISEIKAQETLDQKYYTYDEIYKKLSEWANCYPTICKLESIGKSYEGRDIWAIKISDNVNINEKEPAVLIMGAHHAREWISFEVPMAVAKTLIDNYNTDEKIKRIVDEREIWIVPMVNPDGVVYSQNNSTYWRKNRRRNYNGSYGVDPNRNYGYKWATVGSSSSPSADTYHGTAPFSELETQAIRDLAARELFSADISFHSYGELILYPWSWTAEEQCEHNELFAKFASEMAQFNKYKAQQSSKLYPSGGDTDDYLYATHKSLSFTYELARTFIPSPSQISTICNQNIPAVLHLIEKAGTYGLVTPAGDELISSISSVDAVNAIVDLIPFASNSLVIADRLNKLHNTLAHRIAFDEIYGNGKTLNLLREALKNSSDNNCKCVLSSILATAQNIKKFNYFHCEPNTIDVNLPFSR